MEHVTICFGLKNGSVIKYKRSDQSTVIPESIDEIHQYMMDNSVINIETDTKVISFLPSEITYLEILKPAAAGSLSVSDIVVE